MSHFETICAVIVGVLSVARTARLIVFDDYPPMVWLRSHWEARWGDEGWAALISCQFCCTPYLSAGMAAWAWLAYSDGSQWGLHWTWWLVNGVWGLSYVAAIVVAFDSWNEE